MITSVRALCSRSVLGSGIRALTNGSGVPKVPRYIHKVEGRAGETVSFGDALTKTFEGNAESGPEIPHETDFLIVGGGVIGSSIAYWLRKIGEKVGRITILEKDPTYRKCATTLSAGGIRQQFSLEENIRLAMFGAEFLSDYKEYLGQDAPDPQFNPEGYLFLANTDEGAQQMEENFELQKRVGARVRLYSNEMLKGRFPFVNADGVKLASYGLQNEGWFDPWSLLNGLKQWNLRNDIGYLNAELVDCRFEEWPLDEDRMMTSVNGAIIRMPDGSIREMKFCIAVIAAGADSGHVGRIFRMGEGEASDILSVPIPVEPRKRYVYGFHAPEAPIVGFPFLIDSTGTYVRREGLGGHFVCGKSPSPEDDTCDTNIDTVDEAYFNNVLWPILANRVPAFGNLKLRNSWAGCYDYNYLDENAIIGMHPFFRNVGICTGFSGHGLQMAPAAGRAIAEIILDNACQTIDVGRFGFERVLMGERLMEREIV